MLRLVIGMTNYTGVACGIAFEKSVGQNVPEEWGLDHIQIRRLLALFPGSIAEEVSTKVSPSIGAEDEKVRADLAAAMEADESAKAVEEPEEEVVEEEAEEVEEDAEPVELDDDEKVARLVEENSKDELVELAEKVGATHAVRATKLDIAREIVEKEV